MKALKWNDIFELEEGDPTAEEGYKIKVFKPDTTVLEMIYAWSEYTKKCHVQNVRVLLIDDKVFPSDYIFYRLHRAGLLTPVNGNVVPDNETWQGLLCKKVAKYGCFFRIPEARTFFDLYLRLEEPRPMMIVQPKALLHQWQYDRAIEEMNKQIKNGSVVMVPHYFNVVDTNMYDTETEIQIEYEREAFKNGQD